jgi:hypothetical protein
MYVDVFKMVANDVIKIVYQPNLKWIAYFVLKVYFIIRNI